MEIGSGSPSLSTSSSLRRNVLVTTLIEENCRSAPFDAGHSLLDDRWRTNSSQTVRIYAEKGVLKCDAASWSWIRHIRLAQDCQSHNFELRADDFEDHLVLHATKRTSPAAANLFLWFSPEILTRLQIPHLSLANIRGEKKYVCHRCPYQCEMPNPLKIHLARDCGKLTTRQLWRRLASPSPPSSSSSTLSPPLPSAQLALAPAMALLGSGTSHDHDDDAVVKSSVTRIVDTRAVAIGRGRWNSAFEPYRKLSLPLPTVSPLPASPPLPPPSKMALEKRNAEMRVDGGVAKIYSMVRDELVGSGGPIRADVDPTTTILYKRAVEMETIASNLGKFERGHLCIYCGKVYSRKYGLKIHIRTHTGFKPLKCKVCLRAFGDPSNLNKHVRLHAEGDTPYKCDQCGKILVRKRDLERHTRSRHESVF